MAATGFIIEPTADELLAFATSADNDYHPLHTIFKWAGFTLGAKYPHSPGGALLTLLGSEWVARSGADTTDPKVPSITMDEFASTPYEELEANMEMVTWRFGTVSDPAVLEKPTLEPSELMGAKSLHRIKGRKAHRAAGIACGLIVPRAVQAAATAARDDLTDRYRLEKIALMTQSAANKGTQVAINEIADVTIVRSIPLMTLTSFNDKYKNFQRLMHRPPHSWEECSIQQLSAVEELLRQGVCYVDLSIFGSNKQRSAKLMWV